MNNDNQTTGSSTTHTSTGGGSITPASLSSEGDILDVIKFVVIIIIGALIFSILSDCFYTVKELFKDDLIKEMSSGGLMSMFAEDSIVETKDNELEVLNQFIEVQNLNEYK